MRRNRVKDYTHLLKSFAFNKSKRNVGSRDFIVDVGWFCFLRWKYDNMLMDILTETGIQYKDRVAKRNRGLE